MPTYCEICKNTFEEVHPIPLSVHIMNMCDDACEKSGDDIRCFCFVFVPFSFVIDVLCVCPRYTIKCCINVKQKHANKPVITIQPIKTIVSEPM